MLRQQLADAITTGELRLLDVDAVAMAIYGAVRNAGEYVLGSSDSRAAVDVANQTIAAIVDGLRGD